MSGIVKGLTLAAVMGTLLSLLLLAQHPRPTNSNVVASGDLSGFYPSPTVASVSTGLAVNGGGFKHQSVTTGSINATTYASVTLTWTTAFADANYSPFCTVVEATTTALTVRVHHIESFDATKVIAGVYNDASGAKTGTLRCMAVHQ